MIGRGGERRDPEGRTLLGQRMEPIRGRWSHDPSPLRYDCGTGLQSSSGVSVWRRVCGRVLVKHEPRTPPRSLACALHWSRQAARRSPPRLQPAVGRIPRRVDAILAVDLGGASAMTGESSE